MLSQHTIHYYMNINELRQYCFDSHASLRELRLQAVPLICSPSVVQEMEESVVPTSPHVVVYWPKVTLDLPLLCWKVGPWDSVTLRLVCNWHIRYWGNLGEGRISSRRRFTCNTYTYNSI